MVKKSTEGMQPLFSLSALPICCQADRPVEDVEPRRPWKRLRPGEDAELFRALRRQRNEPFDFSTIRSRSAEGTVTISRMTEAAAIVMDTTEVLTVLCRTSETDKKNTVPTDAVATRRAMRTVLGTLAASDEDKVFLYPFAHLLLPEQLRAYQDVSGDMPMDYASIASCVALGWYDDCPSQFVRDVVDVHAYCAAFNGTDTPFFAAAVKQLKLLFSSPLQKWTAMMMPSGVPETADSGPTAASSTGSKNLTTVCAVRAVAIRCILRIQDELKKPASSSSLGLKPTDEEVLLVDRISLDQILRSVAHGRYDAAGLIQLFRDVELCLWTAVANARQPSRLARDDGSWQHATKVRLQWPTVFEEELRASISCKTLQQILLSYGVRGSSLLPRTKYQIARSTEVGASASEPSLFLVHVIRQLEKNPKAGQFWYLCLNDCISEAGAARRQASSGSTGSGVNATASDFRAVELLATLCVAQIHDGEESSVFLRQHVDKCRTEIERLATLVAQKNGPTAPVSRDICELRSLFVSLVKQR